MAAEFFEAFGGHPLLGRTFSRDDHEPGRHHVVVLSHALWQQQFGRDPAVIGRTIDLSGTPHTVVGVMPSSFGDGDDLLWLPQPYRGNSPPRPRRVGSAIRYSPWLLASVPV